LCTIPGKLAALAFAPDGSAIVYDRNAPPKPTTRVDGVLWHHCRFCEYAAKQKGHIKRHEASHLGDKPFECQYCDATFATKDQLANHERTHTGERPFECQYCDNTFTHKTTLAYHERTHTGERRHGCGECGARFTRRGDLVRHQRTHTGIKPTAPAPTPVPPPLDGTTPRYRYAAVLGPVPDNDGAVMHTAPAAATPTAGFACSSCGLGYELSKGGVHACFTPSVPCLPCMLHVSQSKPSCPPPRLYL
jgi:hypothetical protein